MKIKSIATGKETSISKEVWAKMKPLGLQGKFTIISREDEPAMPIDVQNRLNENKAKKAVKTNQTDAGSETPPDEKGI